MNASPNHDGFMDADMLKLWRRMGPLPGGLRLYGGTALAMYLNHRKSTDFDFATPEAVVDMAFVSKIPWAAGARLVGGTGMVDAVVKSGGRSVSVTFMECGQMLPMPLKSPVQAPNGVQVAHPVDIAAAKVEACFGRGAVRDYEDLAAAVQAWPDWCMEACGSLVGRDVVGVARALSAPPADAAAKLGKSQLDALGSFARVLLLAGSGCNP